MSNEPTMIKINGVSKRYIIRSSRGKQNLKTKLSQTARRIIHPFKGVDKEDFWALRDITFDVKKGEKVGIIGRNGAGKSTLLKILSRITEPTSGRIEMLGRVSAMLEVGTGFNAELTGRENVYLNGAILGMSKKEIDEKFEAIVEFSEVGQFIDTPVKRYSSGMFVRLAFAVASHLEPDILVVDEVLAVGDAKFQRKCITRMMDIANSGKTILYVSHQMSTIRQLCDRVIVLSEGRIVYDGDVEKAIEIYSDSVDTNLTFKDLRDVKRNVRPGSKAQMLDVQILERDSCVWKIGQTIKYRLHVHASGDISDLRAEFQLRSLMDAPIAKATSVSLGEMKAGEDKYFNLSLADSRIAPGKYYAGLELCQTDGGIFVPHDNIVGAFSFEIVDNDDEDCTGVAWNSAWWGNMMLPDITLE